MLLNRLIIAALLLLALSACSTAVPALRSQASSLVDELTRQGAAEHISADYHGIVETFEHGEALLHVKRDEQEADRYYQIVLQKGRQAAATLQQIKQRIAEEELRRAAEQRAREEEERLMREAAQAEEQLREQTQREAAEEAARSAAPPRSVLREEPVRKVSSYTVRRGETLPQIAARPEVYNNSSLWPLIYRANRDQVRDPKHLWPGQVLKIPRSYPSR